MPDTGNPDGMVLNIQRLSTEDGPGIRSTVFMKGCPLACGWCHNPESIDPKVQIHWLQVHCMQCGTCVQTCSQSALELTTAGLLIDRQRCDVCGNCVQTCPTNALQLLGQQRSVLEVCDELLKDRSYYQSSGGGVTLSGGEPGLQPVFLQALVQALGAEQIHIALDTCGLYAWDRMLPVLQTVDLILFDLKLIDEQQHRVHTGQSNRLILENLLKLAAARREGSLPADLWIRTPLIPAATMAPDNLRGIGDFLRCELADQVALWELCAFNNLCQDKYSRLGRSWHYHDVPLLTTAEQDECAFHARYAVDGVIAVKVTGPQKIETVAAN